MPVIITEIVTEVVLAPTGAGGAPAGTPAGAAEPDPAFVETIVRRATERVLEQLRQEWER
jgi:hypothetical protein